MTPTGPEHIFDVRTVPIDRRTLIEASAGTGKTFAISTLVVRLLLERDSSIDQILVVTFTEAATAELKERIRTRIRDAQSLCRDPRFETDPTLRDLVHGCANPEHAERKLAAALTAFDDAAIFTIHGYCHRVLTECAFDAGVDFDAELLKDIRPLSEEVLLDFWTRETAHVPLPFLEKLYEQGFRPGQLGSFASYVGQTQSLRVLPEAIEDAPMPDLEPVQSAYDDCKGLWSPDICDLIIAAGLDGNRYRKASVPNWGRELTEYFSFERVRLPPPEKLEKFGNARLEAAKTGRTRAVPTHPFFDSVDAFLRRLEPFDEATARSVLAFKRRLVDYLRRELPHRKRINRVLSFDDLLSHLHAALHSKRGGFLAARLRHSYPVALIDEFQDTDPIQYAIFDKIYSGHNAALFMIGDPKQAIYSFRGADVFAYLSAARSVSDERRSTMATNYRSAPALVEAVNRVFSANPLPFFFTEIGYPQVEARADATQDLELPTAEHPAPLQFRLIRRAPGERTLDRRIKTHHLPRIVAAEISRLLNGGARIRGRALTPRDFAVLTRTNQEAFDVQRALHELSVPAVVLGDRSVYEYGEASDLEMLLSAIVEPANSRTLRAALLTDLIGLRASALARLEGDDAGWDQWVERFRAWNQRWMSHGFVQMMRQVLSECEVAERLLQLADGERRMTNLLHLIELLHTEAALSHLGPAGVTHYLAEQRQRSFSTADTEQVRLESDEDAVVLTTIHKSKGLEYPIVFCPTLHNGLLVHSADKHLTRYHDEARGHALTLDLGSGLRPEHEERMKDEALAENLRLLYVALTRAKYRCIVHWGAFYEFDNSALSYSLYGGPLCVADTPPALDAVTKHVRGLDDDELAEGITALDPTRRFIAVNDENRNATGTPFARQEVGLAELACRSVDSSARAQVTWSRTASFSSLVTHQSHTADPLDGKDHDEQSTTLELSPTIAQRVTLADFPGGTATGNLFHSLLEHCDFTATDHDELISNKLREFGYPHEHQPVVSRALSEILTTPFAEGLALRDVPREQRLDELEFTLPSWHARGSSFTPNALASVFERHSSEQLPKDYARRLKELEFAPLVGYLKGYVDLIFTHGGRWYLVDYKTNNLGDAYPHYGESQVRQAMGSSHYVLQYHLYLVALHRYLKFRLADYDYDRHVAGAYYLFLRGMHPDHTPDSSKIGYGVFFEKPPLERIEQLGQALNSIAKGGGR